MPPPLAIPVDHCYINTERYEMQFDDVLRGRRSIRGYKPDPVPKELIKEVLDSKIRPAVARDGGDIKFKSFENGIVKVELQGSCSGCPSSTMTLKQGVQNLLCHYVKEVKSVEAI